MLAAFPTTTKDQIEQMINMDGREVTFFTATYSGCPICSLDPITDTSVDSFCPICSGVYWIPTYSGWNITAHVTWGTLDSKTWETGGMIDNGECTVKFIYSGGMQDILDETHYVMVDNRKMDVQPGIIFRGVPEINRIIVKLKEREK